ncbi:MAG: GntR family transcriptional regulator [Clostridiales bacterium]|jgi:DNA-binding GntR family transcriptional regulator|nr:GntR family transcriptional regulator [Clostridiales bacterium]
MSIFESSEKSGSLTSKVFSYLESEILSGNLAPGTVLTESKISTELGVSRTPVREAIFQLEQLGLVRLSQNKSAVVVGISKKDIDDIYTIRLLIEGLASKWAAERISDDEIKKLEEILELESFYAEKGDIAKSRNMDTEFHSILYAASGSNPLRNTLKSFHNYIGRARELSFASNDRAKIATAEHIEILKAIKERDGEKAERLTREHIENARANIHADLKDE